MFQEELNRGSGYPSVTDDQEERARTLTATEPMQRTPAWWANSMTRSLAVTIVVVFALIILCLCFQN